MIFKSDKTTGMTTKLVLERPAHTPLHLVPSSISGDMHPGIKKYESIGRVDKFNSNELNINLVRITDKTHRTK